MKKSVFFILHGIVIAFFVYEIISSTIVFSKYPNQPFHLILMDNILRYGSFLGFLYLTYWLFLPRFLMKKEYFKFVVGLLLVNAGYVLYYHYAAVFTYHLKYNYHNFIPGYWYGSLIEAIFIGLLGTSFRLFFQWDKDATQKVELEKQNYKSELSLLKNQLNPHFLFNTLNNIDSLISDNPVNASLALNKLSEIMRYMVYDSEKEFVPLQDEINYLQNYISLQKLRISNQDIIQFQVSGVLDDLRIAPMLFISFVENAFKHSSLKNLPENTIEIKIEANRDCLSFSCRNRIAEIQKDQSSGVGLELVRKRLELIYKNRYNLKVDSADNEFNVKLDLTL